MTDPIEFQVHGADESPFTYLGCFVDSGDRDLNGGGSAVASVPFAAAMECMTRCVGESQPYFGLQWVNECFCSDRYGTQGEADIADCDSDGTLDDDGTASLCANGQGNCGWRNAVYSIGNPPPTIRLSDGPYFTGDTITVSFTGAENSLDWIGLYAEGSTLTEYMDWVYHHGAQDNTGAFTTDGTVTIALPDQAGMYFVQMLANNGYDPMTAPIEFTVHADGETPFTYLGCFVDSGDRDLNGGGSAVASVPFAAAMECMTRCVGESQPYFGLQWVNECFCSDQYGTQGEADIADCDEDGVLDADGTASLCANGQGNCGWRNAVYDNGYVASLQDVVFTQKTQDQINAAGVENADLSYDVYPANILLDAMLDDWNGIPILSQTPFRRGGTVGEDANGATAGGDWCEFDEYDGGIHNGIDDQSMAFALAWNSNTLFMGVKTIDDTHQNPGSGWNGDTLQIAFTNAAC